MANVIGEFVAKIGADMQGFEKGMASAEKSMGGFAQSFEKHRKAIGIGLAAIGATVIGVGVMSVKAAADAEEMTAKFDTVFKDSAQSVRAWAEETAKAMGRSRLDFMEMAASVQDTFVPMGFARDKAAELSKELTVLAVDVASFNNKVDADVMRDFQSALVGNTETVRKYGIVITAAGVEQEILKQGWADSTSEITEAMKVQARFNMIMAGTEDAQGDAIRTADSFTNQMKALNAAVREVKVAIGDQLLPVLTPLVTRVSEVVTNIALWANDNKELFNTIVKAIGVVGILSAGLGGLLLILPGLTTAVGLFGTVLHVALGPVGLITLAIGALAAGVIWLTTNWDRLTGKVQRKPIDDIAEAVNETSTEFDTATDAADDYAEALKNMGKEADDTVKSITEMIKELQFSNTMAGLADITMKDLYGVMQAHGWTVEQITEMYSRFGDEQTNVNDAIKAMGLSERDALYWVKKLETERETAQEKLFTMGETAESAPWKQRIITAGERFQRGAISEERYNKLLEAAVSGYKSTLVETPAGMGGAVQMPSIIVNVGGSVISERDLAEVVREQLYQIQSRNVDLELQ
uniref:Putative tail tape measure protein n=1 Tax=viral metagenome TaxID=1070528 RepID=A0A6M3KU62_9ZZZZ